MFASVAHGVSGVLQCLPGSTHRILLDTSLVPVFGALEQLLAAPPQPMISSVFYGLGKV